MIWVAHTWPCLRINSALNFFPPMKSGLRTFIEFSSSHEAQLRGERGTFLLVRVKKEGAKFEAAEISEKARDQSRWFLRTYMVHMETEI